MVKPLIIAVAGDTNCGKSTFLNTIIGEKVLAAKSQSETALVTVLTPSDSELKAVLADGSEHVGPAEIKSAIKDRNRFIRQEIKAGRSPPVEQVRIQTGLNPELHELQGTEDEPIVKLIDMPGANEYGNPHMKYCAQLAYTFADVLVVLIKHDQTNTEATSDLFRNIMQSCPYQFQNSDVINHFFIVITHADQSADDSDDEDGQGGAVQNLRESLQRMECLREHPAFAANVPIFTVNAQSREASDGYDNQWPQVETSLIQLGRAAPAVIRGRQLRAGRTLKCQVDAIMMMMPTEWPEHAQRLMRPVELEKEKDRERWKTWALRAAALGVTVVVVGGCIQIYCLYGVTTVVLVPAVEAVAAVEGVAGVAGQAAVAAGWLGLGDFIALPCVGLTASIPAVEAVVAVEAVAAVAAVAAETAAVTTAVGYIAMVSAGISSLAGIGAAACQMSDKEMTTILGTSSGADVGAMQVQEAFRASRDRFPTSADQVQNDESYTDILRYPRENQAAVDDFEEILGKDCFPGDFEHSMPADDLGACKRTCASLGCGAFVVRQGVAYFKSQNARECQAGICNEVEAIVYLCKARPVFYIGQFRGMKPHGQGQLFWPTGQPMFKGEMRDGKMYKGYLIDETNRVHGQFKFDEEDAQLDGFQPGAVEDKCIVCMDNWPMGIADSLVFRSCYHGQVCRYCAERLRDCPTCRGSIKDEDGNLELISI